MMWKAGSPLLLILMMSLVLIIVGCNDEDSSDNNPIYPPDEPLYDTKVVQGNVDLPDGLNVSLTDLDVITFAGESGVGANGSFAVDILSESTGPKVAVVMGEGGDEPVLFGLYDEDDEQFEITLETTALAMSMLCPNLFGLSVEEREQYLSAAQANPLYADFMTALAEAYVENGEDALDLELNPSLYQHLVALMETTMESMGIGGPQEIEELDERDPPYLEGEGNGRVDLMNPTFVYYGGGIYVDQVTWQHTYTVDRREEVVEVWGWPPFMISGDEPTSITLSDGTYAITFDRGLDFENMLNWDDPAGRATLLNTAQIILSIIDLIVGNLPLVPDPALLVSHFHVSGDQMAELTLELAQRDETGVLIVFMDIIQSNSEGIALWIWQENQNDAAHAFVSASASVLKNLAIVFKLLSFANSTGPFIYDLVFAPGDATYFVTLSGGDIVDLGENYPPTAYYSVDPPAGIIATEFLFDASLSYDDNDVLDDLDFRWDFDGDGVFEVGWTSNYMATHSYASRGAWEFVLEVRDQQGLVGATSGIVNVGGGAGTATHVKYFIDRLPWNNGANGNESMYVVLGLLGYSEGQGPNTYEVLPSSQMGSVALDPDEDLVIIANDQETSFYMNYAANMARFNNFVYMGGSMFWEACDRGWNPQGFMDLAGVVLPGNVYLDYDYQNYNYVADPLLPLTAGLPNEVYHNYASHEAFLNLPLGTTVYMTDGRGLPTLIEYSLGGGWVVVTGQPLEHQYHYPSGVLDVETLLPRIMAYFLGVEPPTSIDRAREPEQTIPSSGSSDIK